MLAFTISPQEKTPELSIRPQGHYLLLESADLDGVAPLESLRSRSGWRRAASRGGRKKDPSGPKQTESVMRTNGNARTLRHG